MNSSRQSPDFLVIGGMKCGSTTLYHDLQSHPGVALAEKEFNVLSRSGATAGSVRQAYRAAFQSAHQSQVLGDVSTTYSMAPDYVGVAELAREVLPAHAKIVYVVRDPLTRAVSHHHHMHTWPGEGRMSDDIDECVQSRPEIINYSRYAWQLRPWRECFGDSNIRVIRFEDYVSDRSGVLESLFAFLGLPHRTGAGSSHRTYNRSARKPVLTPFWTRVQTSSIYHAYFRKRIPSSVKETLARLILPRAPERLRPPSDETVARILAAAHEDEPELREFLGFAQPVWTWPERAGRDLAPRAA